MKNSTSHLMKALSIWAVLGVSTLTAQVADKIVANIPFDFTVLDKHFSAGTYTFRSDTLQSPILIRGEKDDTVMLVLAPSAQAPKIQEQAKLVFYRYGNQYFLRKIWYPGTDQGRELRVSKAEQEVARNMPKPEETILLARSKQRKPNR